MFREVDKLRTALSGRGLIPSAIVIAGRLDTNLWVDLHRHAVPTWELPEGLRAPWIQGVYQEIPILNIRETEGSHTLYVADLAAFATLTRYGPDTQFSVDEIDEARAREILEKNPQVVAIPSGRPDTLEERLRLLQLRVLLRLYESVGLELKDPDAALGADLSAS